MHSLSRSLDGSVKYQYNLLKSPNPKNNLGKSPMKQTKEDPHLILCNNAEFRGRIYQYHLDHNYQGSLKRLGEKLAKRDSGKSVNVWCLLTSALEAQPEYMQLTDVYQKRCRREMSRYLFDNVTPWIRSQKNNPPVDNNYTGLEQIFNTSVEKDATEINTIERLVTLGAKKVETPDGWKVEF